MCAPVDAELPDLPLKRPLPSGERLTLAVEDGALSSAYAVAAPALSGTGIVVCPALASEGHSAVAIDYYARTAGTEPRPEDWDPWDGHFQATTADTYRADVAAAIAHLRTEFGVSRVLTLGFCVGGGVSFNQAHAGHGLAGVIGLYGLGTGWRQLPAATDHMAQVECPVLALYGGADDIVNPAAAAAFDEALTAGDIPHETHIYPGAPHSFFDKGFVEYADECRDVWQRVLTFAETARPL
jgi:carboxymethylenebutenolidase